MYGGKKDCSLYERNKIDKINLENRESNMQNDQETTGAPV